MARESYMTAVKAIMKVYGKAVGEMKSLRCTENTQLGEIKGIGNYTVKEFEALGVSCSWNCEFYMIDLNRSGIPGLDERNVQSVEEYANNMMLGIVPIDLYIYKKDAVVTNGSLIVKEAKEKEFAIIRDIRLESSSFNVDEGQISGRSQSGRYRDPIIFPK
jgi:hypothetical protein